MACKTRFLCSPDTLDIIGMSILFIQWFIIIPICVIGLILLTTKYRQQGIIRYREFRLTFVFSLWILCEMAIERPYIECYSVLYCFGSLPIPPWTLTFAYSLFFFTMYALHALRIWKLYYIQQCNQCIADHCWTSSINKNLTGTIKENWFIKHRLKYGNTLWLMRIFIPFTIFTTLLGPFIVAFWNNETWPHYLNPIWMTIPIIFGIYILYKARNIVDIYGIKLEFTLSTITIAITLSIYYGSFLLFTFGAFGDVTSMEALRISWSGYNIAGSFNMIFMGIITMIFPIYWHKKMKSGHNSTYSQISQMGMMSILKSPLGFRMFMKYLVKGLYMHLFPFILL